MPPNPTRLWKPGAAAVGFVLYAAIARAWLGLDWVACCLIGGILTAFMLRHVDAPHDAFRR